MIIGHFWNPEDFDNFKKLTSSAVLDKCNVVIDLSRVTFVNSRGLGIFVTVARNFFENGLKCVIYCPREELVNTMRIAGINLVVTVTENESAVESFFTEE